MYLSIIKKRTEIRSLEEKVAFAKMIAETRRKYGDLSNEQNVHRMICDMAGGCKRKTQNLLYIKIGKDGHMFYIQSDCKLDKDAVRGCGYGIAAVKDEGEFLKLIENGDRLILRAKLAPVKREIRTHTLCSLAQSPKEKMEWLMRLAENNGFQFVGTLQESIMEHIRWRKNEQGHSWTNAFLYTAEIEVVDKDAFIRAVHYGVGRYKAYGCGMLMIAER